VSVPAVPTVPRPGRRPLAAQPASVTSAYDIALSGEAALTRAALRAVLASPARARTAVLAAEILGPPRALHPHSTH
jgi:hypothetical protein